MNLVSLNLNHRTHKKRLPEGLFPALATHSPDVIVFNELVIGDGRPELHHAFRGLGLSFVAVSPAVPYSPGRWQNQVAIASRWPIQVMAVPAGPDASANTNVLSVQTAGTSLIGVRAPGYKRMADWYAWWEWFIALANAQVLIGDFNVDPARARKKDRAFQPLMTSKGYARATPTGTWSYRGTNGTMAFLDHVFTRGVQLQSARYVQEPFCPNMTDHAALYVRLNTTRSETPCPPTC